QLLSYFVSRFMMPTICNRTSVTVKSKASAITKGFLILTAISTLLLAMFYVGYEWSRLGGLEDVEASMEAILYSVSLIFLIGIIVSLVLIWRPKGLNSPQS
ncbi:MAG: hypothetical protein QF898_04665, partial [SAR202 cluster bacterium]|nr:hypothetical protein [SAR202 cluster bacterium]